MRRLKCWQSRQSDLLIDILLACPFFQFQREKELRAYGYINYDDTYNDIRITPEGKKLTEVYGRLQTLIILTSVGVG